MLAPLNPKGVELLLLSVSYPSFLSTFVSYSLLNLVFAHCFFSSCSVVTPIFFNHTSSSFLNPLSPSTFPLASFYQVQTTFAPQFLFKEIFSDAFYVSKRVCSKSISNTINCLFFVPLYFIHISFKPCFPFNTLFSEQSDKIQED